MSKRVYVKGAKTHAKDESFKADERERFQVSIDLMSLKTLKDYDIMGWRGEFYFKVDGEKALKTRFPDVGTIKLQRNEEFTSKSDMNLYTQFKTLSTGEKNTVEAIVELREKDRLKKDQVVAKQKFEIKLPQKTEYVILQDKKEQTKAKLRLRSVRTRY
jgi:hypothetical protein